ncbi:MAG TPA: carbohydrate kinase family protein, partial [Verrucomicrobiae bacterium]|nr:carbohydrate kinase family protein [Verrucomicrobiae bacterium]
SACAAAALGAKVRFVGKTGADSHADRLKAILQNHGVRTYLRPDPDCATGTTVAIGFQTGQRHFLSWLPNNRTLKFKDLDLRALAATQHLLRADVWFSEQMLQDGNRKLLAAARAQGLRTSLDINFDPAWSSGPGREIRRRKMALRKVLPLVDVAHGNERELCEFTDSPGLTTALERLSTWGAGSVVVHLGAKGAGYFTGDDLVIEPADKARNPVQATGTGDVLSVCMILLDSQKGIGIRDKLRIANRVVREFMEGKRILIPEL